MRKLLLLIGLLGVVSLLYSNDVQAFSLPSLMKNIFEMNRQPPVKLFADVFKPTVAKPKLKPTNIKLKQMPAGIKPTGNLKQVLKPQIAKTSCPTGSDCDDDGDGHTLINGQDCNDADSNVYPGAPEVCDAEGKDEDCNPTTVGFRDDDRDGYVSPLCTNTDSRGITLAGEDCDDGKEGIFPGIQVCDPSGSDARRVLICRRGGYSNPYSCLGSGETCVSQPSGAGVCIPQ